MNAARGVWRLLRAGVHLFHGIAIMALRFPALDAAARRERIAWWSARLLGLLGLQLEVDGAPARGPLLVVANHVSWLDIAALHACCPQARFVSKSDVLHWPLIGWMVRGAGTLFIQRENRRDAMRVVHQVADALRGGDTIAVFPEGTTSDGRGVLPFHANLLQAAIASAAPVQAAVLRFSDPRHAVSPAAEFVGATTLAQSAWRIASAEGLRVRVAWLAPLPPAEGHRRDLAQRLQALIGRELAAAPEAATADQLFSRV